MTFTEKLRGLLEKATPGPWERREGRYGYDITKERYQITLAKDLFEYNVQTVLLLVNAAPALVRLLEVVRAGHGAKGMPIHFYCGVCAALDGLDKEAER